MEREAEGEQERDGERGRVRLARKPRGDVKIELKTNPTEDKDLVLYKELIKFIKISDEM